MLKTKNRFVVGASFLLGLTTLVGCSAAVKDAQENIDTTTVNAMNQSQAVRVITQEEFKEFTFLGADFERSDSSALNVEVSGLAKYGEEQSAFVNLGYTDVESFFSEINQEDKAAIINALSAVIQERELTDFEMTPVSSAAVVNDTLKDIAESPLDNYRYNNGMVFAVGNVSFNEEEGYASFEVKSNIEYSHTYSQITYGIVGRNSDGSFRYGPITKIKTEYEDFLHTHRIYVRASEAEISAMQNDMSLIFDKFYTVVKDGEKENYVVESLEVQSSQEFNTKMKDDVSYKDL